MGQLLDEAVSEAGQLDVLVSNPGITRDATTRKMTEKELDAVITVNLNGCWHGTRLAAGIIS